MFGGNHTVFLDQSSALSVVGLIGALFAFWIFKKGLELFICGTPDDPFARLKGFIMTAIATALLVISIMVILESAKVAALLSTTIIGSVFQFFSNLLTAA